jgi:hypothetical protein
MKYRKLRIAWSVGWGIACLLLVVLWVRSYWWTDSANCPLPGGKTFLVNSLRGQLSIGALSLFPVISGRPQPDWKVNWKFQITRGERFDPPKDYKFRQFTGTWDQSGVYVQSPYWLAVFVSGGLAAVPWLAWSRRFSLRTLLAVMTLVAVGLGAIVYSMR